MLKLVIENPDPSISLPVETRSTASGIQAWYDDQGNASAYSFTQNGRYWVHYPGLASFSFNRKAKHARAIPHRHVTKRLIQDIYRRFFLPIAIQALGSEVLHASAILATNGVIALCGHSGTGKSTTAFGLVNLGYKLWADDTVAFDPSGPYARVIPLPCAIRLNDDARQFFGTATLEPFSTSPDESFSRDEAQMRRLAAIGVLERIPLQDEPCLPTAVQLSSVEALPAVLPYAHCFAFTDLDERKRLLGHYLDLIQKVPVFRVRFQPNFKEFPSLLACIRAVVDDVVGAVNHPLKADQ